MSSILCIVVTHTLQQMMNGAERAPLTNNVGRRHALAKTPQDIELIENVRKEFANFIKHQFALDEILT